MRSSTDGRNRAVVACVVAALLTAGFATALGLHSPGSPPRCPALTSGDALARSPVHHVFFLIKENHAFENYFGDRPGVLGYPPNGSFPIANGSDERVAPFPLLGASTPDLPHDHASELADLDGGRLDGFVAQAQAAGVTDPADAVGYYGPSTIPQYYAYADHYALADRFFTGVLGPTLPNRVFDLAGTAGNWTSDATPPPSVFGFPTIFDQLESRGIPYAYDYAGDPGLAAPFAIPSFATNPCETVNFADVTELPEQLDSAHAPAVTFIDPSDDPMVSEHPSANVTVGAEWTATVVNTILTSPVASSSVIFVSFDEGGGFWDPVAPPSMGPTGDGFRVPLLVLSPWTPAGALLDAPLDPAALLRFVDDNWGMPPLNERVGDAPNLTGFFRFDGPLNSPLLLPSGVSLGAGEPPRGGDAAWASHAASLRSLVANGNFGPWDFSKTTSEIRRLNPEATDYVPNRRLKEN